MPDKSCNDQASFCLYRLGLSIAPVSIFIVYVMHFIWHSLLTFSIKWTDSHWFTNILPKYFCEVFSWHFFFPFPSGVVWCHSPIVCVCVCVLHACVYSCTFSLMDLSLLWKWGTLPLMSLKFLYLVDHVANVIIYWINELAMKWPATPDLKMNFRGPESYLDHFLSKVSVSSQIAFPCGHYCIKYTSQMCFDSQTNQI